MYCQNEAASSGFRTQDTRGVHSSAAAVPSCQLPLLPPDTRTAVSTQVMGTPWHQPMPMRNLKRHWYHQTHGKHSPEAPGGMLKHHQVHKKHTAAPGHVHHQEMDRFKRFRRNKREHVSFARVTVEAAQLVTPLCQHVYPC